MELCTKDIVFGWFAVCLLSWVEELVDERHRRFAENVKRRGSHISRVPVSTQRDVDFRDAMETFTELGNSKDGGEGIRGGGGGVRYAKKSMFEGDF